MRSKLIDNLTSSINKEDESIIVLSDIPIINNNVIKYTTIEAHNIIFDVMAKNDIGVAVGSILSGWKFNIGATKITKSIELLKYQKGYKEIELWENNISDFSLSNNIFVKSDDYSFNKEMFWSNVIKPICGRLEKSLDPSLKKRKVYIGLPPCNDTVFSVTWEDVFAGIFRKNIEIIVYDFLLEIASWYASKYKKLKKLYIVWFPFNEKDNPYCYGNIVSYTTSDGSIDQKINSEAFIEENNIIMINTVSVNSRSIIINANDIEKSINKEFKLTWKNVIPLSNDNIDLRNFLIKHSTYFTREYYRVVDISNHKNHNFTKLINDNGPQTVEYICTSLLKNELINIALKDVILITNTLEEDKSFAMAMLSTGRKIILNDMDIPIDNSFLDLIPMLPSNYFEFKLKSTRSSGIINDYFKINIDNIDFDTLIRKIIEHFDNCTVYILAEELLTFYGKEGDPSAYLTAKLFLYLSSLDYYTIIPKYYTSIN